MIRPAGSLNDRCCGAQPLRALHEPLSSSAFRKTCDTVGLMSPAQASQASGAISAIAPCTRRVLTVGDADRGAELADKAAFAVPLADLAGDEDEAAGNRERPVIGHRCGGLRQLDAELLEPRLDLSAHRPPLTLSVRRIGSLSALSSPPRNRRIRCVVPFPCALSVMSFFHCCSLRQLPMPRPSARRRSASPPTACWWSTVAATVARSGPCLGRSATSRRSRRSTRSSCCAPTIRSANSYCRNCTPPCNSLSRPSCAC